MGGNVVDALVPNLHDPLLSVDDICNKDLASVFGSHGCKVYHSESLKSISLVLGEGYRKGNLGMCS